MNKIQIFAVVAALLASGSALANVLIYNQTLYPIKAIVKWDGGSKTIENIQPNAKRDNPTKEDAKITADVVNIKRHYIIFAEYNGKYVQVADEKVSDAGNRRVFVTYTGDKPFDENAGASELVLNPKGFRVRTEPYTR